MRSYAKHIKVLTPFLYLVVQEADRVLRYHRLFEEKQAEALGKPVPSKDSKIFTNAHGLITVKEYLNDPKALAFPEGDKDLVQTLKGIYREDSKERELYYFFTDPEYIFTPNRSLTATYTRLFHTLALQLFHNRLLAKAVVFLGNRVVIPEVLKPYIQVQEIPSASLRELDNLAQIIGKGTKNPRVFQSSSVKRLRGLALPEAQRVLRSAITASQEERPNHLDIDDQYVRGAVREFRTQQFMDSGMTVTDTSNYTSEVLGGAEAFKSWLEAVKPTWSEEGQAFGLAPPKAILCIGVWGCGKSLAAKIAGNVWDVPLVNFDIGLLRAGVIGESEQRMRRALRAIESLAPCAIWIDEAEKNMAGAQSSSQSDSGVMARLIGAFSNWLQETDAQICVLATANTLHGLPPEFVSRSDMCWFFGMPSREERVQILKIHLIKRGQDPQAEDDGSPRYNLFELSDASKGMVGREIEQAVKQAMTFSFNAGSKFLQHDILLEEIKRMPRLLDTMGDTVKSVISWVGYDPDRKDGVRARLASKSSIDMFQV